MLAHTLPVVFFFRKSGSHFEHENRGTLDDKLDVSAALRPRRRLAVLKATMFAPVNRVMWSDWVGLIMRLAFRFQTFRILDEGDLSDLLISGWLAVLISDYTESEARHAGSLFSWYGSEPRSSPRLGSPRVACQLQPPRSEAHFGNDDDASGVDNEDDDDKKHAVSDGVAEPETQ